MYPVFGVVLLSRCYTRQNYLQAVIKSSKNQAMLNLNKQSSHLAEKNLNTETRRHSITVRKKAIRHHPAYIKQVLNKFLVGLGSLPLMRGSYKLKKLSATKQKEATPSAPVRSLAVVIFGQFLINMLIFTPLVILLSFCYGPLGD